MTLWKPVTQKQAENALLHSPLQKKPITDFFKSKKALSFGNTLYFHLLNAEEKQERINNTKKYPNTVASSTHQDLAGFIWNIANKLRGPYRPTQYRHVMLPMTILRRLDLVLEPTRKACHPEQ